MGRLFGNLLAVVLVVGAVVAAALADRQLFPDAEDSPLYASTLEGAYSRFEAQDARVAARPPTDVNVGAARPATTPAASAARPGAVPVPQERAAAQGGNFPGAPDYPPELLEKLRAAAAQRAAAQPAGTTTPVPAGPPFDPAGVGAAASAHQHGVEESAHDHQHPALVLGEQLFAEGRDDEALVQLQLAATELPDCSQVNHRLGDLLQRLGRSDAAALHYEKVLAVNPSYTCCHTHIGEIRAAQGRQLDARAAFEQAEAGYRAQVAQGGPLATSAKYHLAELFVKQQSNAAEALSLAQEAVAEAPDQPAFLHLLSLAYELNGDKQSAREAIERAIELAPAQPHLGEVLHRLRHETEAGAADDTDPDGEP